MGVSIRYLELRCSGCSWTEVCGPPQIAAWLRRVRKVHPGKEPESEILIELLLAAAETLACPECGRVGLLASPCAEDFGDWPEAVTCDTCSTPIPEERLAILPGTTRCAACQQNEESGRAPTEPDYCPRCGSLMELRPSHSGGVARYVLACTGNPPCRR